MKWRMQFHPLQFSYFMLLHFNICWYNPWVLLGQRQVSMLSEDESDAEVMQRLAPLSRSIQDFIAASLGVDDWFLVHDMVAMTVARWRLVDSNRREATGWIENLINAWLRYTSADSDVADLTERWLCETFSLCARKAGNGQKLASMSAP